MPGTTYPNPFTLPINRYSEAARRAIYDAVVLVHFSMTPEEIREAQRKEEWYPTYTADEAGLRVFYAYGRWFAAWRRLEMDDPNPRLDVHKRFEMLRVEKNSHLPHGLEFYEV
jgi:hypothetical protein